MSPPSPLATPYPYTTCLAGRRVFQGAFKITFFLKDTLMSYPVSQAGTVSFGAKLIFHFLEKRGKIDRIFTFFWF
jgi:hypothetical protein